MAYTKTTWNNLSNPPINADNLNKIEQGIYDNSLATDIINPSGTATTSAEIEEGQITDVIGFKSLKLKGQTSQYTTTGKNLLAIKQLTTQTINGVTFTPHYTGNKLDYVNVNGTATATAGYFLDNANIDQASTYTNELPSGTYILDDFSGSSSVNTAIFFRYSTDNSNLTTINSVENSRKITIDSTFKYASYIRINNGTTVNNMKFYPQLETGSTQTTYEPYTNGASPNPDFPQDVNNVSGYNVVRISNKNILKFETAKTNVVAGVTMTCDDNTTFTMNGTKTSGTQLVSAFNLQPTKLVGQYKFTGYTRQDTYVQLYWKDKNGTIKYSTLNSSPTINFSEGDYLYQLFIYIGANVSATFNNETFHFQLEKGTTATSYIEYQGNNFEINLGKNLANIDDIQLQKNWHNETDTTRASIVNIPVKPNTTYSLSSSYKNLSITNVRCILFGAIGDTTHKGVVTGTFTTTSTTNYLSIEVLANATFTQSMLNGLEIQLEKGAIATPHTEYFTPIEICKIGTYQDYIYKHNGKWYKHKEVGKRTLNGTENWVLESNYSRYSVQNLITDYLPAERGRALCTHYTQGDTSTDGHFGLSPSNNYLYMHFPTTDVDTVAEFKDWLSNNNVTIYYVLTTPTDEEITYAPLLRQLDEVYNSGLYDVTNISQDNSSEAFILDLEACKNNINGIVEYIRR